MATWEQFIQASIAPKGLRARLERVSTKSTHLRHPDMDLSPSTPSEESVIASFQSDVPLVVEPGKKVSLEIAARETFTTNGTADDTETFSLSHDLVEQGANDLVLYEGGTRVQPDAVDYDANTFDYTDDSTATDLTAYYLAGAQASVEVRKVAPKNVSESLIREDAGLTNYRDTYKDPVEFEPDHPLHGIVPEDWDLEVRVKGPYTVEFDHDGDGEIEAVPIEIDLPIRKARTTIDGLKRACRRAASEA